MRNLKNKIFSILQGDYPGFLRNLLDYPPYKVINILFSGLLASDERIKWHSVVGFGVLLDKIAKDDFGKARIVMRRCMWMLNDESGGIGWGVPEAMAEAMVNCYGLAKEYHKIFLSYLFEEKDGKDNFLEFLPLRRGGFWGLARLCFRYPTVFKNNSKLFDRLDQSLKTDKDPYIISYSFLALKALKENFLFECEFKSAIKIFWNYKFYKIRNSKELGDLL